MSEYHFKYHPDPIATGTFNTDKTVTCDCCGKQTDVYYTSPFYTTAKVSSLCPECIASGEAAKKFKGEFLDPEAAEGVSDKAKIDELVHRTPSFHSWQEPMWIAHCDDFCAFLGTKTWEEAEEMGIAKDIEENYSEEDTGWSFKEAREHMENNGDPVFKCLHCGKHFIYLDLD